MDILISLLRLLCALPLAVAMAGYPCACGACPHCKCKEPAQIALTMSGLANMACTSCGDFNDTFVTDFVEHDRGFCYWRLTDTFPCDIDNVLVVISAVNISAGGEHDDLELGPHFGVLDEVSTPLDCQGFSSTVLTHDGENSSACDVSSATFSITTV